jgi:hypothetical protein
MNTLAEQGKPVGRASEREPTDRARIYFQKSCPVWLTGPGVLRCLIL